MIFLMMLIGGGFLYVTGDPEKVERDQYDCYLQSGQESVLADYNTFHKRFWMNDEGECCQIKIENARAINTC